MNLESHESSEDRQYAQYKDQFNMTDEEKYLIEAAEHVMKTRSVVLISSLNGYDGFKRGFVAGRRASAAELDQVKKRSAEENEWISVEERLPERNEPAWWYNDENVHEIMNENDHATVLAMCAKKGMIKAVYDRWGHWNEVATFGTSSIVEITHWRPLPSPPYRQNTR